MHRTVEVRLCRGLALFWAGFTIVYLLFISVLILQDAAFSLKLGSIHTIGRAGLWVTLLPALLGLIALVLVWKHVRTGAWLLGVYALFWAGLMLSGLPGVWNARTSFCTRSFCITTPWIGRLLLLALATSFLLVVVWTYRESKRLAGAS